MDTLARRCLSALAVVALAACAAPAPLDGDGPRGLEAGVASPDPVLAPGALRTADGAPVVVVVETRDRSMAVTAALVRDPSRTDLRELVAPRVMADVAPALFFVGAPSP